MNILAIESSCDETAAAVVWDGRTVLSNCIASQIEMHTIYGGVVHEICLLYTSPSPRDGLLSRMPSSA